VSRSFAMQVFAATYWLLAALFVYILAVLILPELAKNPDQVGPFLPLIGGFLIVFVIGAAVATFWRSAPQRGWVWLVLIIPPVLFLLMNAPFIPYSVTHPADIGFTAVLPLLIGTIVLIWAGAVAFREARSGVRTGGSRARVAVSIVAGVTLGAFATGYLAAGAGGGAGTVAAAPTTSATLVAEGTKYLTTSYSIGSSDVLGMFVENKDSIAHSFDVDALNIHVQVPANSTVALAVKPTGVGTLEFYCAIPGHKAAGMAGTITIQ
jgi:hypothetical protein